MLRRLDEGTVVPLLGRDLLTIDPGIGTRPLYPFLAEKVATVLEVSASDLPPGDELVEIARRAVLAERSSQAIYHAVRKVFRELEPIAVPAPLARLAEIDKLRLFVTTTFDGLMERALDEARFEGQRQTLAFVYAPNDKQDLPPEIDRLNRPAVFYLMGRLSATPRSYAVTRDDVLEFTESLHSRSEDAPFYLFDKLGASDLLFVGTRVADWLAHLFAREPDVARRVDAAANGGEAPVVFLERASGTAFAYPGQDAQSFAFELKDRFLELATSEETTPPEIASHLQSLGTIPPGAVVLSSALADRETAESIRLSLDRAGVDVILDIDDVELALKWEMKLKHCLSECSLFLPLFSARASRTERRWARPGWSKIVKRARETMASLEGGSGKLVVPCLLDESSVDDFVLPEALAVEADGWQRIGAAGPSDAFVDRAVERQRRYRRAVYA